MCFFRAVSACLRRCWSVVVLRDWDRLFFGIMKVLEEVMDVDVFVFNSFRSGCFSRMGIVVVLTSRHFFFFPIAALPKADCLLREEGVAAADDDDDDADDDRAKKVCRRDVGRGWITIDTDGNDVDFVVVELLPPPMNRWALSRVLCKRQTMVLVTLLLVILSEILGHGCRCKCKCDCTMVLLKLLLLLGISTEVNAAATTAPTTTTSTTMNNRRFMVRMLVIVE